MSETFLMKKYRKGLILLNQFKWSLFSKCLSVMYTATATALIHVDFFALCEATPLCFPFTISYLGLEPRSRLSLYISITYKFL